MAIGWQGPMLLEDALDIADMMEWSGRVVPRSRWVDDYRIEAERAAMASMFGI